MRRCSAPRQTVAIKSLSGGQVVSTRLSHWWCDGCSCWILEDRLWQWRLRLQHPEKISLKSFALTIFPILIKPKSAKGFVLNKGTQLYSFSFLNVFKWHMPAVIYIALFPSHRCIHKVGSIDNFVVTFHVITFQSQLFKTINQGHRNKYQISFGNKYQISFGLCDCHDNCKISLLTSW